VDARSRMKIAEAGGGEREKRKARPSSTRAARTCAGAVTGRPNDDLATIEVPTRVLPAIEAANDEVPRSRSCGVAALGKRRLGCRRVEDARQLTPDESKAQGPLITGLFSRSA